MSKLAKKDKKKKGKLRFAPTGLNFLVGRIRRSMHSDKYAVQIGANTSMYLTVVLQYPIIEALQLAGNATHSNKKHRSYVERR
ncbi:Core histone H2A/H2B/H3/H4 family protein [Acanthocheilonema viteae]